MNDVDAGFCQLMSAVAGCAIFVFVYCNTGQGEWSWSPRLTPEDLERHHRYRVIAGIVGGLLAFPGVIRVVCASWMGIVL